MRIFIGMKRYSCCLCLLLAFTVTVFSQEGKYSLHNWRGAKRAALANSNHTTSTGFSGTGANIDVVYHRANWQVNPNNGVFISGTVATYFKTMQPNVASISFDLVKSSFQNSVQATYHGINCTVSFAASGNVNVLNIELPVVIASANTIDSISIAYSGAPAPDGLGGGFVTENYQDQFGNLQNYITTLSESFEDKNWWPCKADMQDKIDSMDISVTVPWENADTFWVASNGLLIDSALQGGFRTFKYKTRYPMASYLVFLSAAKYRRYYSSVQVGDDNIPVYWYLLGEKQEPYYTNALNAMKQMNAVVQAFSSKLGDYPFKKEKHGYYDGLVGAAGMEHQTFSGIAPDALTSLATLDHELMHQWFGDNVTFGTWNDLWLAEGFARYGETIAAELVPALGYSPFTRRRGIKNGALSLTNTSLWIPDANIANSLQIWASSYGTAVYERGAMVVSMLRTICGDEKFFHALKNYQTVLAGVSASTDSLKRYFNNELGTDISEFFNDYVGGSGNGSIAIGGKGNPVYEIKWNSPGTNKLLLGVQSQTRNASSNVSYFNGPVVVRATGSLPLQDTTIVFFDWGNGNLSKAGNGIGMVAGGNVLSYDLSFTPTTMFYDDSARTLTTGSMIADTAFKGYIWHGAVSSNWFDAANWENCCGVPPANANVTIASVNFAPMLPADVTVHDITINDSKYIGLAANELTINGAVKGNGKIQGTSLSKLVINHKAGLLRFSAEEAGSPMLQLLTVNPGASATIATDLQVIQMNIHPAANVAVPAGIQVTTY